MNAGQPGRYLLADQPVESIDAYVSAGGGEGLRRALSIGSDSTIDELRSAKLRGRGGAGFPTGIKWRGVADPPKSKPVAMGDPIPATIRQIWWELDQILTKPRT